MYIKKYEDFILENQEYVKMPPILLDLKDNVDKALVSDIENFSSIGDNLLEISCGNGSDAFYLKSIGYNLTCTEYNDDYIEHCKNIGLNVIKHDTQNIFPFTDKQFDLTYSRLGLHYFTTDMLLSIFDEIARVTSKYLIYTVKLANDNIQSSKIILSKEEWEGITLNKFEIISSNKKSGLLYGSQSNWLEVIAKVK